MSRMSYPSRTDVLLRVRDLSTEIRAGYGGASCAVRTLDGVSLSVRAGEMIIVRGGVASGASTLIDTLSGRRTCDQGERAVSARVQVRRAGIGALAFNAMYAAWTDAHGAMSPAPGASGRVVYVLRVKSATARPRAATDTIAWRTWASALRANGHSVIAQLVDPSPAMAPYRTGKHEHREPDRPAVRENLVSGNSVRVLTLAAGRIVSEA